MNNNSHLSQEIPIILFVEDEPNMRNLVEKVFSEKNYKIITAANGIRAMEILIHTTPDLIVSDIMMPEMNGIDFFQSVQNRYGEKRPGFMFLTAKNEEDDIISGLSLGADDYITKPISIRQLVSKIESKIKQIQAQKRHLSTGLRGNLNDQRVADIIQFIELAEHTGQLSIKYHNREGQIQFRNGQIVWADFPPLTGADAVYVLIALESGTFYFENSEDISTTNRIKADNFALILEAMKRIDEAGRDKLLNSVMDEPKVFSPLESLTEEKSLSMTDTLPISTIPEMDFLDSEEDYDSGDTFRMRVIKSTPAHQITEEQPVDIVIPEWVQSFDFNNLCRIISELENGDFSGQWIASDHVRETADLLRAEPGCLIVAYSDELHRIFKVISELFIMKPADENSLCMVSTSMTPTSRFRILGYPLEAAGSIPENFLGIPSLIFIPSNNIETGVPLLTFLHLEKTSGCSTLVSDNPDDVLEAITNYFPNVDIPMVMGNFSTWLGTLLTLSRSLKAFRPISR